MKNKYCRKSGFTLIELLVVIAIIALLLSIVMPSLNRSRAKARQIVCMAHLRDVGIALHTYAGDNDDYFPNRETVGGFVFRAAPGYRDTTDRRGAPERYGIAAVLGQSDIWGMSPPGAYIDGHSKVWVCPAQPHQWMRDIGNTYCYSVAGMLKTTKTTGMKRFHKTWLIWDNYMSYPYTPGSYLNTGDGETATGFTIPADQRIYPHNISNAENRKDARAINILYADSHAAPAFQQFQNQ